MLGWALFVVAAAVQSSGTTTEAFKFDYIRMKDRIEADGRTRRVVEMSVVLRTPPAVREFGQIAAPYVEGYGEVTFDQIRVQKPSGTTSEITDARIEDLNPFGINDAAIPVDVRFKKLTIPRLEPGDRLSYRVTTSQRAFVPGEASGEMRFTPVPADAPQVYELDIPAVSRLTVNVRADLGASWEVLPSEKDRLVRRLTLNVAPPVVASTGLTEAQTEMLQRPDVSYSTFASWSMVGHWWWDMSRAQLKGDEVIAQQAARLTAGKATPREKVEAIAAFVSSSVRYLNVSFGAGRMQPRSAVSVLSSKYGDCKDKAGLVIALAEASGVEVRPALIHSTRVRLQDEAPGPHQFDHMIAVAILGPSEKDWLWIDPTNTLSPATMLAQSLRDKRALVVDRRGEGRMFQTPASIPGAARRAVELTGSVDSDGLFKGRVKVTERSDSESALRASFGGGAPEQHAEMVKSWLGAPWKNARFKSVRAADSVDVEHPFWIEFEFERDVTGIESEKEWKFWVPDLGPVLFEPSKDSTTVKPVRFDVVESSFRASVDLPEGTTARAPLSVSLDRPFATLASRYSVEGRTLKSERVIRFLQPSVAREQLPAYDAFQKAADTDREQNFSIGPMKSAAPTAAGLQKEGKAAYARKEYPKAIELLQKAIAADPKLPEAHFDLGLAYRDSKKYEEAIAEYAKAIEVDPFHERVYAERAYALFFLDRDDEAEKDLLKQIEVAPFKDWSYGRLAQLRDRQERYLEAAELYTKALAIDGSDVNRWLDAAWAFARGRKFEEARKAYDKARTLGLKEGQGVRAAFGYRLMGDLKTAASLAQEDLAGVSKNVALITPKNMSSSYLYWVRRLAQAWMIIGEEALEAKDIPKAEKFLKAAWDLAFLPNAAFGLGQIRETQGNVSGALELWSAAIMLSNWDTRPPDLGDRIGKLRKGGDMLSDGSQEMARLRFIKIPGPSTIDAEAEVLVLASGGKVTGALNTSKKNEVVLAPVLGRLIGQPVSLASPDGTPVTLLRAGLLTCSRRAGCQFIAKIESVSLTPTAIDFGDIRIVKMSPADKSTITAGEVVHLVVSAAYDLKGTEPGVVGLMVGTQPQDLLVTPPPMRAVQPGKGTVEFDVTFTAPRNEREVRVFLPLSTKKAPTRTVASAVFSVKP